MMTLKSLPRRFAFGPDDGPSVEVERIGAGRFTTAYRQTADPTVVYLVVNDEDGDYSKDIIANCDGPYFPALEKMGTYRDATVWKTRYYQRLRASYHIAWSEFRAAADCRERVYTEVMRRSDTRKMPFYRLGHEVMAQTVDKLRDEYPNYHGLADALGQLTDESANYGSSYVFEFAARNLAVDNTGHLILLDPIFDLESMEKMRQAALRRGQSRYRL